jgi:hypothetical protein
LPQDVEMIATGRSVIATGRWYCHRTLSYCHRTFSYCHMTLILPHDAELLPQDVEFLPQDVKLSRNQPCSSSLLLWDEEVTQFLFINSVTCLSYAISCIYIAICHSLLCEQCFDVSCGSICLYCWNHWHHSQNII